VDPAPDGALPEIGLGFDDGIAFFFLLATMTIVWHAKGRGHNLRAAHGRVEDTQKP
jgi:hypothetical protein